MSKLTIKTGTEDDFFRRGRQLARSSDRGEALPSESTISFEDPADVVKLITDGHERLQKDGCTGIYRIVRARAGHYG